MSKEVGNYSKHAQIWDWGGYDRTQEFEFWCKLAETYGKNVLSAMAAIGEVGAYMARNGFKVTATDYTKEMIDEGMSRHGNIPNLDFIQADIRNFKFQKKIYDFAFIGSTDLHHLQTEDDIKAALNSIHQHLRSGGGLGLELWYPSNKSWKSPKRIFEPANPKSDEKVRVWKEGETEYSSVNKKVKIHQTVYIQDGNKTESFIHDLELQLFTRKSFLKTLSECGYSIKAEYGGYSWESWTPESPKWIVEAVKV